MGAGSVESGFDCLNTDALVGGETVSAVDEHQARAVLAHLDSLGKPVPTVLAGDTNEWAARGGVFRCFDDGWDILDCGRSFPTRRPIARLDRMIVTKHWEVEDTGAHHSLLSSRASDPLPVWARLKL